MKPPRTGTFQVELAGPICKTCNVDTRLLSDHTVYHYCKIPTIFFKDLFFIYVYLCLEVCMRQITDVQAPKQARRRPRFPGAGVRGDCEAVSCSMCMLGTEHDSSERAFSSAPKLKSFYEYILVSSKLYIILT